MRVARATPPQRPPGPEYTGDVYFCGPNETVSTGDRLVYGAKGVAQGPGDSGKLKVQFEGNKGTVECWLAHLSLTPPPAELLGGYRVGEPVYFTGKDHTLKSGNRKANGWRGVVAGPNMNYPDTHLSVKFEQNKGSTLIILRLVELSFIFRSFGWIGFIWFSFSMLTH